MKMPQTDREKGLAFVVLLAIVAVVAYYMYPWTSKQNELAEQRTHIESLESENHKAQQELAKGTVADLRAEALRYQRNLQVMRQLVPTGNEVPVLLDQVSTAARHAGLDLGDIQPQPVIGGAQFDTYRYRIGMLGSYHALGEFLANVGSLTRIVAPVNVTLQVSNDAAKAKGRVGKNEALLDAKFEIQTYVAKAAPAPAQKAGGE